MNYHMKKPCNMCPFRKDCMKGWLGKERMEEILSSGSFVCHKTAYGKDKDRRQCAGHMILKGERNDFVQLANRLGFNLELSGEDLIFDNDADCIEHHGN